MKTLVLVRHAKSDWDDPSLPDHQRPLNARGRHDAPRMGRRMRERGLAPEIVISSSAVRALSTATVIAGELGIDADDIRVLDLLYGASPATMLDVLGELDDDVASAMLVAHDPGMSDLAAHFTVESGADAIARMPTCAVATFTFDVGSWSDLDTARPTSTHFDAPALI